MNKSLKIFEIVSACFLSPISSAAFSPDEYSNPALSVGTISNDNKTTECNLRLPAETLYASLESLHFVSC